MDRNREARRTTMAASNGLQRRRHRTSSLRDSPEEDGPVELQETARLRDRGSGKKDRDRDRDRERDRDRDRERDRDRLSRSKRRRGDRLTHGNRDDGGDESSEESVNDEEEDEDDDGGVGGGVGGGSVRMLPPPNPSAVASLSSSSSMLNHQRKSFPPVKNFRAAPTWKAADEMIGVSVPRKARSASTKRSHEWSSSGIGIVGEQIHRQASTSPVRPSISSAAAPIPSQAPVSPSSSNASVRKKLKPNNGPKPRQLKPSSRSSSSAQDEIEIEIAEVLYGMMRQPQGPSKQEIMANDSIKLESRENTNKSTSDANKSSSDAKSRVSSPISCSQYGVPPQTSSRSSQPVGEPAWALCTAPKRKKPRLVKYDAKYEDAKPPLLTTQSNPISSAAKGPPDQLAKTEASSAPSEKNAGSAAENGGIASDTAQSHAVPARATEAQPEPIKLEKSLVTESKPVAEKSESRDLEVSKEEPQSPKRVSPGLRLDDKRETITATAKPNSTTAEIEIQREEKFQIDLMAPPPSRSSPERDSEVDFVAVDAKPMALDAETEIKPVIKEDAKALKIGREESSANVEPEKTKASTTTTTPVEVEAESKKPSVGKERNIDLQLDLEKTDTRDGGAVGVSGNKLHQHILPHRHQQQQQQQQHQQQQQQTNNEKTPQSGAVPLPISMPGWPGGLPHMGYMAPLQGMVSMDGTAVSSAAIQPPPYLFNQPRPKRCATHCYIARSICYHQQIARMNSFWPAAAAAGSGSLYGAKPCNLNVLPSPDLNANIPGRGINSVQDKGQGLAMFPGHNGKDKASQAANVVDSQRKQILLQQALPPGAPSNILQGPAIIFPLSQQQAVAASSVRPGSVKSPAAGNPTTSSTPNSTSATASATAAAAAPAMTFNYPNIPGNEATQYLAINAYSFPIPAHVGAPPAYRGTHHQAMPFFNGSFYPTFHPSQLQQQQPPSHSQQNQQSHQNPSMSSSSSSSQKHLQNQQHRPPHAGGHVNGGSGSLQGFPTPKNQSSQPLQLQQRQQQGQHLSHPARQLESEMGSEDSPSTADSRVSRPSMSIYGQNFPMQIHAPNFALMTPASIGTAGGANGAGGNNVEKKQQQQQQQQGSKISGVEPSQAFAMSFASINGTAPGLDITSIATQQQAIFPDVRQGYQQYMAAAAVAAAQAVAQQKKNYRGPEDGKTGGDSSNLEEERKTMKGSSGVGQAIAFSRPDLSDASVSTIPGTTVVDSSARTLNLGSTQQRPSGSVMPAAISNVNASSAQQQLQRNHQQQHMIQLQKQQQQQQQQLAAVARTKTPAASNGSVYSDHLSSSMAAKFPNALSTFPQNLVHSSSSPAQSPQWKSSVRSNTPQVPSPSMTSSTSSSLKNLSQQQGRTQQTHTQISFAANPKPSSQSQGLQPASSNQTPSPPIMVGSPTTSSVSKSAGGSPRTTTSTSTGNKVGQASSLSSQQAKNSPSIPNMKSSPVAGKNVPSILGNPHITSSSSAGTKAQLSQQQQQQQQQQLSKHSLQQAQLFFAPYIPAQAPHSNSPTASTAAASSTYYSQRRRPEQQQQSQSASVMSSSGMLSLCSVTTSNTSTSDAKAAAAAAATASNMKGLPSQALMHPAQFAAAAQSGNTHQLLPVGFPYVHAVPAAVQVKPAEQKQPAGE